MKETYKLATDHQLNEMIDNRQTLKHLFGYFGETTSHTLIAMFLELREYRKIYGPLGCDSLDAVDPPNPIGNKLLTPYTKVI